MQVVLCAARRHLSAEHVQRLRGLLRPDLDWDQLVYLALQHRVMPLFHRHVRAHAQDLVPAAVWSTLHNLFLQNASLQFSLTAELIQLLSALEGQGIPVVPYKGPALADALYGNITLRQSGDLDILVRRRDVERARQVLVARGHRPQKALTEAGRAFMMRSRYSEGLAREDGLTVELHWAFTNGDVSFPLTLDHLLPRLQEARLGGAVVRAFRPDDHLIVLCVHGAKHLWTRLEWTCGVAELIRSGTTWDWDDLLSRARDLGVERMVLLGAFLAYDLLDAPLPPEVVRRAQKNEVVVALAEEVRVVMAMPRVPTENTGEYDSLRPDIFHFRLRERLADQLRFLMYRITTPSQPENWITLPIGRWSVPVHSLLRPIRVSTKILPAVLWYARRVRQRRVPL